MIDWRDCIVPIRKREPKAKRGAAHMPKKQYTAADKLTALTLEARRRKLRSYGELEQVTTWEEQEEIIASYVAQKESQAKQKCQQCAGCIYHKRLGNDSTVTHCTFHQHHRLRRKDGAGQCLEYTRTKKKGT